MKRFSPVFSALLLAGAVVAAGCGSDPITDPPKGQDAGAKTDGGGNIQFPDGGGPDQPEILALHVVGSNQPTLQLGGTVRLYALLVASGKGVVPGKLINFTINAGAGTLSAPSATTDAAGIAHVTFTASNDVSGNVMVTASAQDVLEENNAQWLVKVIRPQHYLYTTGASVVSLVEGKSAAVRFRLQDDQAKGIPGATITFQAQGSRGGVLINGRNSDTGSGITAVDGTVEAQLSLTKATLNPPFSFTLVADAQFSDPRPVTVNVTPRDNTCYNDSECLSTERCNLDTYLCELRPGCETDMDCGPGMTCSNGKCLEPTGTTCTTHAQCGEGNHCDYGECWVGCTDNAHCAAGRICELNRNKCVSPGGGPCTSSADCTGGYSCQSNVCVFDPTASPTCGDSVDCPSGTYCNLSMGICIDGCDQDWQCPQGKCDISTATCTDPGCTTDPTSCTNGTICNLANGKCEPPGSTIWDVTTTWMKVTHKFHITNMAPSGVKDVLDKIGTGFDIAIAIVEGDVGRFLPDWVPGFVKDAVSTAVKAAIGEYVPDWLLKAVYIGSDVMEVTRELELRGTMTYKQPRTGTTDKTLVSGKQQWTKLVFYWYTPDCPHADPGKPPPNCAFIEIDLLKAAAAPAATDFLGHIEASTLYIESHSILFKYGKAVRLLLEYLLQQLTGQESIKDALLSVVDCQAINDWVVGIATDIVGEDIGGSINITNSCTSAIGSAATAVTGYLDNLPALDTNFTISGKAGITVNPGNTTNKADHLVNGIWDGSFNGSSKPHLGDWKADR